MSPIKNLELEALWWKRDLYYHWNNWNPIEEKELNNKVIYEAFHVNSPTKNSTYLELFNFLYTVTTP